jgi:predicted kinase
MATVHIVCGFLGAGKTTFSKQLAERLGAVRFSIDELYLRLFAQGPTYELDQAALDRLIAALEPLWLETARAGVDVVLDFGCWSRRFRDSLRTQAHAAGSQSRLYWLRCSDQLAVERCLSRNGAPDAFLISEQGYWELRARFEAPAAEESPEAVDTESQSCIVTEPAAS